ncbi:hypothetical protein [Leeuwenhoekiella sp. NPDC079379]|uniref:hypothetical protein n=1 Tax=Leeuwenhoekiella sp. NPDC079379 TaxID=3364122 RepID=UPI0037C74B6E
MNTSAYNHDSEYDLFQKNIRAELYTWIKLLENLNLEFEALVKLVNLNLVLDTSLIQKIVDKKAETNSQLNIYYKYVNQVEDNRECDDMDCEIFYQRQHEQLRRLFNYHAEQCTKLKCSLFNSINLQTNNQLKSNF